MLIAHDPGHGHNNDPGCAHNGIIERELVLDIARSMMSSIPWAQQMLLRDSPVGEAMSERAARAARSGAGLVLLHHANANDDPACHGLMSFYDPTDDAAQEVATSIARAAPQPLWRGGNSTAATTANWPRVLWCLQHYRKLGLSAVLIEWGFASNARDAAFLLSAEMRPAIIATAGVGIAQAMTRQKKIGTS